MRRSKDSKAVKVVNQNIQLIRGGNISLLPGFQLERLKRRRKIQAKLEDMVEEISQEQREVVDPKLFVVDRGGLKKLKTDSRRMGVKTRQTAGVHVWPEGGGG